jgi:nitronate monooxygenase
LDTDAMDLTTAFTKHAGVTVPLIGGAMYPCSNPELVAAVSRAGGLGIVQPVSLVFVHKHQFRDGLRKIKQLAGGKPIGLNLLIEKSSKLYLERNKQWLNEALDEGVRFFITALGDPRWVMDIAKPRGGIVYHDVTERKWAEKAVAAGVDGLICVNDEAGGHAGRQPPQKLYDDLKDMGLPLVCAGGIGSEQGFVRALKTGYAGVQLGTRFIATTECSAHQDYKNAILKAQAKDIVLTEKITGVPVAVIKTRYIEETGVDPNPLARFLLKGAKTKHLARLFYSLKSIWQLKESLQKGSSYKDFFQAGKSVEWIEKVEPAGDIVRRFARHAQEA